MTRAGRCRSLQVTSSYNIRRICMSQRSLGPWEARFQRHPCITSWNLKQAMLNTVIQKLRNRLTLEKAAFKQPFGFVHEFQQSPIEGSISIQNAIRLQQSIKLVIGIVITITSHAYLPSSWHRRGWQGVGICLVGAFF